MSRNGKSTLLISPNSVMANAMLRTIDLVRPRVPAARPTRIEFVVGTQINGAPHLGANLVQTARDEQVNNIRQIYPPEREALGAVAIGIELVDPPRTI